MVDAPTEDGRLLRWRTRFSIRPRYTFREDHWPSYRGQPGARDPLVRGGEGAVLRHLIGDRLDITGARWGLAGAEAVLKLRALNDNGDFDEYWTFHLAREHERFYPTPDHHSYQLTA